MTPHIIEAKWVETLPTHEEGPRYFRVGAVLHSDEGENPKISRITVQTDEPGLHCNMRRVCIWTGDTLAAAFPFIAAGAVGYV